MRNTNFMLDRFERQDEGKILPVSQKAVILDELRKADVPLLATPVAHG